MHVVIVRPVHLSQEAALLVHRFVTYQTLKHNSRQSDTFPISLFLSYISHAASERSQKIILVMTT